MDPLSQLLQQRAQILEAVFNTQAQLIQQRANLEAMDKAVYDTEATLRKLTQDGLEVTRQHNELYAQQQKETAKNDEQREQEERDHFDQKPNRKSRRSK